jgi:hypothetical protein
VVIDGAAKRTFYAASSEVGRHGVTYVCRRLDADHPEPSVSRDVPSGLKGAGSCGHEAQGTGCDHAQRTRGFTRARTWLRSP